MGQFFDELKRRNLFRIGAAYVVIGWGLTSRSSLVVMPGAPLTSLAIVAMG